MQALDKFGKNMLQPFCNTKGWFSLFSTAVKLLTPQVFSWRKRCGTTDAVRAGLWQQFRLVAVSHCLSRVKGRAQLSCPIASLMNRNGKAVRVASPEEAI
ncbi:MAG: hypothetical protein JO249_02250 [Acidobacteria bacterium]|nr:hypothetical protein [Acidobacteriota bacterium]MBV9479560.1 hypothetical protein [Acidobacteriota bacterium]